MPGETTNLKIQYAVAADEVKKFPAEVSQPGAETIDKAVLERTLTTKKYAGSATLKTGELAVQEKTGETFTLPSAATANQVIAMFSTVAELKVTSASEIVGDFQAAATCKLTTNQHLLVQATGVKWVILAGLPKREAVFSAPAEVANNTEVEPSATRPAFVSFTLRAIGTSPLVWELLVGGVKIAEASGHEGSPLEVGAFAFYCPAGLKWKVKYGVNNEKLIVSTVLL